MSDALVDRQSIQDQLAKYAHTFDSRDVEGWAGLFTDDGVFEVRMGASEEPIVRLQGAEQLGAFVTNAPRLAHHITGLIFDELLPDSARTRAVVVGTWVAPDGDPAIYTHGTYEQRWSRNAGTWRLAHQVFISQGYHSAALADLAAGDGG
jgi:hypothetical protein